MISITLARAISSHFAHYSHNLVDWPTIAGLIAAFAAVFLALLALFQLREMRETRKAEYSPQLRVYLYVTKVVLVVLRIANIGRAAAVDIDLTIVFMNAGQVVDKRRFEQDAILPLGNTDLLPPEVDFEKVANKFDHITITGQYRDSLGKLHPVTREIDVNQFVGAIKRAKILARQNGNDEQHN
jgi:hypothetical protein